VVKPIHVGCSGWNYADWRGVIYPKGLATSRWLERYAELFDTVEINTTFYRLPKREAVQRWVEQSPPEFAFAVKASRYLTHIRRLTDLCLLQQRLGGIRGPQRFGDARAPWRVRPPPNPP